MGMNDRMDDRNMIRGRAGRRRLGRGVRRRITAMLACLVVMVAVMFSVVSIYAWIRERVKGDTAASGTDVLDVSIDADGNVVDADGNVVGVLSGSVGLSPEEVEVQVANARQQAASEVLEDIRTRLNDGDSVVEALRPLYPDDMIVYSGGQYHVVPIDYSLKQHGREDAGLNILETGEYQYLQDGQVISHKGIDVSEHQGDIDWNLVAQDGVEFAFIRAAYSTAPGSWWRTRISTPMYRGPRQRASRWEPISTARPSPKRRWWRRPIWCWRKALPTAWNAPSCSMWKRSRNPRAG